MSEHDQWQPIETLPFSNDIVLLACQFDGGGDWRIKCGVKDAHEDTGFLIWGASWTPTHWMPLPAPPVIESI